MSFDEGTEYGERRTSGKSNLLKDNIIPKPEVLRHGKSLQDLAIEHNLSGDQLMLCSHFVVAMKATEKKIKPEELMKIIEHWDAIRKAVKTLNVHL